jgi:large subunit ribosomal protein L13
MKEKEYVWYTGWMGGQKRLTADKMQARKPDFLIRHAVKGMLPKNRLARQQLSKLKVYAGKDHPHKAQTKHAAA